MTQQQDARQCCVEGCEREGIFWQEDGYDDDGEYRLCTVHQEAVNAEFDIAKARQKAWRDSHASLLAALEQTVEHIGRVRRAYFLTGDEGIVADLDEIMRQTTERAALSGVTARKHPADCSECGGAGVLDSGGFQPWGEPINVPCPGPRELLSDPAAAREGQGE